MRFRRIVALSAAAILALTGCTKPVEEPTPEPPTFTRLEIPADFVERIDGSTATIPLTSAAMKWLRGTDDGLTHNKTDSAYHGLIDGLKDLIFVTAPSEGELAAAKQAGVELEVIPVVKDALVFLANTDNPVMSLTQQQVQDIYAAKTTTWSEVGGSNTDILPYQRPVDSGSQTLFLQIAMGSTQPMEASTELQMASMDQLIDAVSEYNNAENALGYSVYYYAQQMYAKDNIKLLGIDGVIPTTETISAGAYPYGTHYYAVIRSDEAADSLSRKLIEWFLADEGQQVSSGVGYVPLDPSNITPLSDINYGYLGSTPENTTQSKGTGGPVGTTPPTLSLDCLDTADACWTSDTVSFPGYPKAEEAAQAWLNSVANHDLKSDEVYETRKVNVYFDLVQVSVGLSTGSVGFPYVVQKSAIFRLTDGHRMTLADFFYDQVNYIEFINQNLLNFDSNHSVAHEYAGHSKPELTGPFTGLPSSFEHFAIKVDYEVVPSQLRFIFSHGNPFVESPVWTERPHWDLYIPLQLPADLSPYGLYWRTDKVMIGSTQVDHLVRDYQGPNPKDQTLNNNIDAFVESTPDWSYFHIRKVADDKVQVDALRYDDGPTYWGPTALFDYFTGEMITVI